MKFYALVLELQLPGKFLPHTETDRHFPKIVKLCLAHPKFWNPKS